MPLAETLPKELLNFKVKLNISTAHDSYEAWREGDHDDLVLSDPVFNRLRTIRDTMEHVEERVIKKGTVGDTITLAVKADSIEL